MIFRAFCTQKQKTNMHWHEQSVKRVKVIQALSVSLVLRLHLKKTYLGRDLTINAIALTSEGEYVDPYNGRKDLNAGILRHVSDAFSEDPLRVLRVARFCRKVCATRFYCS